MACFKLLVAAMAVLLLLLGGCFPVQGDISSFSKKMLIEASITALTDTPRNQMSVMQCIFACQRKRRDMELCEAYRYDSANKACLLGTMADPMESGDVATYVRDVPTVTHVLPGKSGGRLVLHKIPITHPEAQAYCQERGGALFEPRTFELREMALAAFDEVHEMAPGVSGSINPWVNLAEDALNPSNLFWVSDGIQLPAPMPTDNYEVENNGSNEKCFTFRKIGGMMRFLDKTCSGINLGYPLCLMP